MPTTPLTSAGVYFKLWLAAAALLAAAWGSWYVRSVIAERETREAVKKEVAKIERDLKEERRINALYKEISDKKLEELLERVSNIRVEHTTITRNITKEREIHREFYAQPLPPGGFEEWKRARSLVGPSAASSARP